MTDAQLPGAPVPPAYQPAAPAPQQSKTLSIVALILAFLVAPVGAILGFVALNQSKKAGEKNGMALAAIIIGIVFTLIWIISVIVSIALIGAGTSAYETAFIDEFCKTIGEPGVYDAGNGTQITCE